MAPKPSSRGTPLTETQARTLAAWWGGRYLRRQASQANGKPWHGVQLPGAPDDEVAVIYSWQEAQRREGRRNSVNPGAPDWVG
jgi:hypothetical protein